MLLALPPGAHAQMQRRAPNGFFYLPINSDPRIAPNLSLC
jgi:hypothetical protein